MKENEEKYLGLFNDSFPPVMDGVTLTVTHYADWLLQAGLRPCVVTPDSPDKPEVPYPVLRYFSLPIASRHPYRYGYPRLDFSIRRRLRDTPFALVHAHSPFSAGRLALQTARRQGVPLVATFHSKFRTDLEHSLRFFPSLVNWVMKRLVNFFEQADEVWIPQAGVEETVREYGISRPVTVVENGNDMATVPLAELPEFRREARKRLGIEEGVPALLFVGQQIYEKGVGVILEALSLLQKQSIPFIMNYIGTGYALESLRAEIGRMQLQDRVKTLGVIQDRNRLADYYAASDLFLFPSFYDNAPLVVREAAAMGTPALVPQGSTTAEVISDGRNGFLCERTAEDYAAAIRCLAGSPRLELAGMGARKTLVRGWDDVMTEVSGRYAEIISNHKSRR